MREKIKLSEPGFVKDWEKAVADVLTSGDKLVNGEEVRKFEEEFAKYVGADYSIATNSGGTALICALQSLNIQGQDVCVPDFTFIASAFAVLQSGCHACFSDIPFHLGMKEILKRHEISAAIPVHLFGKSCEMNSIVETCNKHNISLIEDCAHAIGTKYSNKHVGTFGEAGCFSFYPTKNMTVGGSGGMIVTNNSQINKVCKETLNYGRNSIGTVERLGYNGTMTTVAGAIGRTQLKRLPEMLEKRKLLANEYNKKLKSSVGFILPTDDKERTWNYYTILCSDRVGTIEKLNNNNIEHAIYYEKLCSEQPPWNNFRFKNDTIYSRYLRDHTLALPLHPNLSITDVEFICETIKY